MNSTTSYSLLLDSDAKILYYSDSLIKLTGASADETYINKPFHEVFESLFTDERFIEASTNRLERVMAGEDFLVDETVAWPDGRKSIYRIGYNRIKDRNDNPEGIIIAALDITALRVEEAERRMNDMLHATLLPCLIWDEGGNVLAYNKEAEKIFGVPEGLPVEDFNEFIFSARHPETQPDGRKTRELREGVVRKALTEGFAQDRVVLKQFDGSPLYLMVNATRLAMQDAYRMVVFFYDMTDLTKKEAEAQQAEEHVKLMFDAIPLGCNLVVLTDDGKFDFIDCNHEVLKLFDMPDKETYFKNFHNLAPERQPDGVLSEEKVNAFLREAYRDGCKTFEWLHRKLDGEYIPVEVELIRLKRGDVYIIASYIRDLR
jgi:PAS domain-containing protein